MPTSGIMYCALRGLVDDFCSRAERDGTVPRYMISATVAAVALHRRARCSPGESHPPRSAWICGTRSGPRKSSNIPCGLTPYEFRPFSAIVSRPMMKGVSRLLRIAARTASSRHGHLCLN